MHHHRKRVQAFLEEKLACEPKKDEIIVKLLHGGGYERKFKAAAAEKFKRVWWLEYKQKVEAHNTVIRCSQMKEQAMMSGRGWDRMNAVERKDWNSGKRIYEPVVIDTGVEGDEGVELPKRKCAKTLSNAMSKFAFSIGVRLLSTDGSAVAMYKVVDEITRQCVETGIQWCTDRLVEVLFSGDAHCSLKRKKMTHFCLRLIGATENDNSPNSMWGLVHWQGNDDWKSISTHCRLLLDAIKLLQQNGSTIEVTFETDSGSKKVVVKLDLLLCADGALLDSDIGGSGFCCEECCVICTCPKKEFGDLDHKIGCSKPRSTSTIVLTCQTMVTTTSLVRTMPASSHAEPRPAGRRKRSD